MCAPRTVVQCIIDSPLSPSQDAVCGQDHSRPVRCPGFAVRASILYIAVQLLEDPNSNFPLAFSTGPDHRLDQAQFNWLGTVFYLFFLAFEWPQNLALQYLPVGKWMRLVSLRRDRALRRVLTRLRRRI